MSTKKQKQRLWAAAKSKGLSNEEIRDMITQATGGRTSSSTEMSGKEIEGLINSLNGNTDTVENRMRKKLIAMAHKLDWQVIEGGKAKVDMERVNNWCVKSGMYHKPLNKHTRQELVNLVSQFETMYESYLEKRTRIQEPS